MYFKLWLLLFRRSIQYTSWLMKPTSTCYQNVTDMHINESFNLYKYYDRWIQYYKSTNRDKKTRKSVYLGL